MPGSLSQCAHADILERSPDHDYWSGFLFALKWLFVRYCLKQFQFIVASRFHAIVHAFKNGIPCIALGWATKYYDLMKQFGQEQYMLDGIVKKSAV